MFYCGNLCRPLLSKIQFALIMVSSPKPLIAYGWLRAILCFICFLLFYILLSSVVNSAVKGSSNHPFSPSVTLFIEVLVVNISFFISAWVFRKFVDRRSFFSLGFQWNSSYARLGLLVAFGVIGIGALLLMALHVLQFSGASFLPGPFLFTVLIFGLVAFGEELFFRGYILNNLLQSLNKWIALGISALLFMFVHLDNPGATASLLPIMAILIGGLLFGINYIYTKNLYFGICLHFAWNFLQGPVLGFDVSGTSSSPIFSHTLKGSTLLTGGTFGYEGSIICVSLSVAALVILILKYERGQRTN